MQTLKPFLENIKNVGLLNIILASIAGHIVNSLWIYIPTVNKIFYGETTATSIPSMPSHIFVWYLLNVFLNTLALSMFITKKGAFNGFIVGLIVALFFSGTAIFGSYIGSGNPLPSAELIIASFVSSVLFYCIPATLVAHLRKD